MTTLILTIDDDGRTRILQAKHQFSVSVTPAEMAEIYPVRSGDDRGHYDVFEVAGVSIDVMRLA